MPPSKSTGGAAIATMPNEESAAENAAAPQRSPAEEAGGLEWEG
jgi:hypothetical protein